MTIILKTTNDDMFESDAEVLVNAVNCVGVMGGGLAKVFKDRYPDMFNKYKIQCDMGLFRIGTVSVTGVDNDQYIINLPTKNDWRNPSELIYVIRGLTALMSAVEDYEFESVAVPALGCGLGGLDWHVVQPYIYMLEDALPDVTWMIYPPQ